MISLHKNQAQKGSVILVALCCVAVLSIALASYIALSNQSVKLSNRAYQQSVSRQLSEAGIEQALWSFNRNNWDPTVWTIDATNHRATRTITFPNTKYGNGVIGSINLRIDNYDAYYQPSIWSATPSINYQVNDLVGYSDGMWYRCVKNHLSTVSLAPGKIDYWVPAPMPWMWSSNTNYYQGSSSANASVVCYNGTWYLCKTDHTSGSLFVVGNWDVIQAPSFSWNSGTTYSQDAFVYSSGVWYRSKVASNTGNVLSDTTFWSTGSPSISWAYRSGVNYAFNDVVYYGTGLGGGKWYRCKNPNTGTSSGPSSSDWEDALSESWKWYSSYSYNLNDVVYYSNSFYRCVLAHSNQVPPNSTYWSSAPLASPAWDAGRQYSVYATVYYNGAWYLCLQNHNGKNPVPNGDTSSPYWALAPQSLTEWISTKNYVINDIVSSGGIWYRCLANHINQPTTNASFWTSTTGATYQWDATIAYSTSSYVSHGGVWYHCILANTNQAPNNATYWAALGTPVIFTEGVATLPDTSSAIKTQLRTTIAKAPLFPNAAATTSTLTLSSNGTVDSYDGSVYGKTTAGADRAYLYDEQSQLPFGSSVSGKNNISYSAVLASTAAASPAVTITNATVKGYVAALSSTTAPYAPLWAFSGSGVLTGLVSGTGIDLTRVSRSPSIPQFETLPSGGLAAAFAASNFPKGTALALATTLNLGTPGAATPSRYYYNGNLNLGGSGSTTTLNINGPIILFINGDLKMDGSPNGAIYINSPGSAEIHIAGGLKVDGASEGITNNTTNPKTLIIIADTTAATTHFYNEGVNFFYGTLYAPSSTALQFTNLNTKIFGAVSAKKIDFTVQATLHYDTSLRFATFGGIDTPFSITEARELTDQTEKILLP